MQREKKNVEKHGRLQSVSLLWEQRICVRTQSRVDYSCMRARGCICVHRPQLVHLPEQSTDGAPYCHTLGSSDRYNNN